MFTINRIFLIGSAVFIAVICGLIGYIAFYFITMSASPARRIVATTYRGDDVSFRVDARSFRAGRYAICMEDPSFVNKEMNTKIGSDLDVFVRLFDSEMKLLKEDHLDKFLAYYPKDGFYVISEFIESGVFSRGQIMVVSLHFKTNSSRNFGLFVSPSPIP